MLEITQIQFIQEIKEQIKAAQYRALQKVNKKHYALLKHWKNNSGKTAIIRLG